MGWGKSPGDEVVTDGGLLRKVIAYGTHVQYTQTDTIRQTDGTIGTNRKAPYSNGSIGEYASH